MRAWFASDELCPVYAPAKMPNDIMESGESVQDFRARHGQFPMEVPPEVLDRWRRVMDEFAEVQTEMRTWHRALLCGAKEREEK